MNLKDLNKKIPYKWRKGPGGTQLAYIDARDVMDILDEVVGQENWQTDYKILGDKIYCGIGIYTDDKWVWKWDMGTESEFEAEKGEASDAFKRAGVKWGIGRFLYDIDPTKSNFQEMKKEAKKKVSNMSKTTKPTYRQMEAVVKIAKAKGDPVTFDDVEGWTFQQASDYIGNRGDGGYYAAMKGVKKGVAK
jgi:hypothetical protein